MTKCFLFLLTIVLCGCTRISAPFDSIVAIQIQDRNGLTETISAPEKLENYDHIDFLAPQPYKKVLRIYREKGKSTSKITTYHANGLIWQYLEAEELRAHGTYLEWHPNGQLKVEAHVIGGTADVAPTAQRDWLFDGVSKVWDEQGRLLAEIPYSQGSLNGVSRHFYPTGGLEKTLPYSNHLLNDVVVEYYPDGKIRAETAYKQGDRNGFSRGFFPNGQKSWEEYYTDDLILKGSYFNVEGELLATVEDGSGFRCLFDGNTLSFLVQVQQGFAEGGVKQFTSQGDLQSMYHVKNGKKVGEEIVYFLPSEKAGKQEGLLPKLSIPWDGNAIHGTVKTWYNNGQLQSERDFCRNKKMGPSLAWYRDGSLMLVEEYEADLLVKGQYYKRNALDTISSITNGNGVATLYDENGIFLRKIPYLKGEPIDTQED